MKCAAYYFRIPYRRIYGWRWSGELRVRPFSAGPAPSVIHIVMVVDELEEPASASCEEHDNLVALLKASDDIPDYLHKVINQWRHEDSHD